MTSTFTWLDYSERERRQMLDVISQFREQDTRDELGLGSVRDAFNWSRSNARKSRGGLTGISITRAKR